MLRRLTKPISLVLVSPQIPPNTGNIARLCAVTGCQLILIGPLGFSIDDRHLRRAGLDYWDKVLLKYYSAFSDYLEAWSLSRRWLFSAKAQKSCFSVDYAPGDHLLFGSETCGLSQEVYERAQGTALTIPMLEGTRSLNLSTAVGIAAYEAIRQLQFSIN
ncbi:MAG: tRNA (cytidine(34)-2'-O)-methyltransferase [Cystobacterineae bacterium]|nr:tRNA (cytidine(34)-2'-O)-methyltransferase [Cystobacterineae bacterium]